MESGSMLMKWHDAGTWEINHDTIVLSSVGVDLETITRKTILLKDEKRNTLHFAGDTSGMGMRIMVNKL